MFSLPGVRRAKPQGDDLAAAVERTQAVAELATDGRILRANKNARALFGYAADAPIRPDILQALCGGQGGVREGKTVRKTGRRFGFARIAFRF